MWDTLESAVDKYERDGEPQILTRAIVQLAGPDPEEWPDGNEEIAEYRTTLERLAERQNVRGPAVRGDAVSRAWTGRKARCIGWAVTFCYKVVACVRLELLRDFRRRAVKEGRVSGLDEHIQRLMAWARRVNNRADHGAQWRRPKNEAKSLT